MFFVYILSCADGTYYTGMTSDIVRRVREHYYKLSKSAKYTKSHPVTGIEAVWECNDRSSALRLEAKIKKLSKKEKISLINGSMNVDRLFEEYSDFHYVRSFDFSFSNIISSCH